MAAQIEAYGMALEGHDPRDIEVAIRKFIRGEVEGHNQSFPPTASKLGGVVRQCLSDRLDSERRAESMKPKLPPPMVHKSPESRRRVLEKTKQAVEDLTDKMLTDDARRGRRKRGFEAGNDGEEFAA